MVRKVLMAISVAAFVAATAPAMAGGCKGCDKLAKSRDGWCCGKGKAFGVELASKKLYTALAGHEADGEKIRCPGCKTALKTSGKCKHCKVAAADGKLFRSPVAHALAKGKLVSTHGTSSCASGCAGCKEAFRSNGWCDKCGVGLVAGRMFKGQSDHKAALVAYKTLTKAASAASNCEACAVAMVTDGSCEHCKVKFKDGKITG